MPVAAIVARHEPEIEKMFDTAPKEIDLRFVPLEDARPVNEGRLAGSSPPASEWLPGAEIVLGPVRESDYAHADVLRWIQIPSIGAESCLYPAIKESDVIVTNCKGVSSTHLSEQGFALLFALSRRIMDHWEQKREAHWQRLSSIELAGGTMGVVGLGHVGRAVAERAYAFGMRVLAVDIEDVEKPDCVERVEKPDRLGEVAAECGVLFSCVPSTPESHKMIDGDTFGRMKPTSYFVNVSRGKVVDEEALIEALSAGRLAGAGLDVTYEEPCPPDNPLWKLPNALISSHSAGSSQNVRRRMLQLFLDNLSHYVNGEPLLNVVDKQKGY